MLEGSTKPCPMCQGTGMVRSVESVALDILRSIEDRLITDGVVPLVATTAVDVALYILNQKRAHLNDIQQRYRIPITVTADEDMHVSQFVIERAAEGEVANGGGPVIHMDWAHHHEQPPVPAETGAPAAAEAEGSEQPRQRSRRRRRRGRRGEGGGETSRPAPSAQGEHAEEDETERFAEVEAEEAKDAEAKDEGGAQARKGPRRRGRRGGRRGRSGQRPPSASGEATVAEAQAEAEEKQNGAARKPRAAEAPDKTVAEVPHHEAERVFESVVRAEEKSSAEARVEAASEPEAPRRKGWWSR
jgi:ribonuclease E